MRHANNEKRKTTHEKGNRTTKSRKYKKAWRKKDNALGILEDETKKRR